MKCAVKLCQREDMEEGHYLCPKHDRRYRKAWDKGTDKNWWRSNQARVPDRAERTAE